MTKQDTVKIVKLLAVVFATFLVLQVFLTSVTASGDFWVTKKPLPTEQIGTAVGASNGMIYVMGDGVNEMYNPITDTWTSKTPMPTNRSYFGIAVYQDKIYCIGGYGDFDGKGATGINEVYNIATDTWETKQSMPTIRGNLIVEVVNGKIYAIGGNRPLEDWWDFDAITHVNEVYDIATDTWSSKNPLPHVGYYVSAVIDNKICVLRSVGTLMIYDTDADLWSYGASFSISEAPAGMGATTGELTPKRIYVICRNSLQRFIGDVLTNNMVQVYDPETDTWSAGTSMPTSRSGGFSVAVVNDCLYVIGGLDSDGHASTANEMYIPFGYNTSALPSNPNTLPEAKLALTDIVLVAVVVAIVVGVVVVIVAQSKKRKT